MSKINKTQECLKCIEEKEDKIIKREQTHTILIGILIVVETIHLVIKFIPWIE